MQRWVYSRDARKGWGRSKMRITVLILVVGGLILTIGCVVGGAFEPKPTPMSEVDYIAQMKLHGETVMQALGNATNVVASLNVNDPEFQAGLEREAARMGEVHDAAALMVAPPKYAEAHTLFVEATGLYRDGLWAAAEVAETGDTDGLAEVGRLMNAADEKLREAGHKVRQRTNEPSGEKAY